MRYDERLKVAVRVADWRCRIANRPTGTLRLSWRARWRLYEYVRNSIWIVPAILGSLAIAMGVALPNLDEGTTTTIGISFGGEAARGLLGALAGGMITFTGFVFSILLLAVQFGSSQFSPRMLRRFLRDPTTKIALGVFMATFIYALLVLRSVGRAPDEDFVPHNSVSVALILLLVSMLAFLRLISRTTQGLRVASVLEDLGRDTRKTIDQVYPEPVDAQGDDVEAFPPGSEASEAVEYKGAPGVLQSVDADGLVALAGRDSVIELLVPIGNFVVTGAPLFRVHGPGGTVDPERLQRSIAIGDERTMTQDPAFAFRLLADISAKVLSPVVNDPTTATQALDQIEVLLRMLARRRLTPGVRRDDAGRVRVRFPAPTWEDYLTLALDETRRFGEGSMQIARRLRALLETLRDEAPQGRRPAVEAELALLQSSVERSFTDPGDRDVAPTRDRQGLGFGGVARREVPGGSKLDRSQSVT
jgi:uncharacterized membrane protein